MYSNGEMELLLYSVTLVVTSYDLHLSLQYGTPLMVAFKSGHVECVKVLLERGAQVDMKDTVRTHV